MVGNSNNINKTNDHLDIARTLTHWTQKTTAYDVRNPGPGSGQALKSAKHLPILSTVEN